MADLVLWAGPVAEFQVPGATVPGATKHFFGCRGDVTPDYPYCPGLADGWVDGGGRRLPKLLASIGLNESDVGRIYLGAFSAGGSAWKRLLENDADRARITALMLSDAMYTAPTTTPIEGFVRFGLDALRDPNKLFVATVSSSPNKTYGSGSDVMRATKAEIEKRAGVHFESGGVLPLSTQPQALFTATTGNVIFADYGMTGGGHGFHPQIAPEVWQRMLLPWLALRAVTPGGNGPGSGEEPTPSPWYPLGLFALGSGLGWAAITLVEKLARRG
jgi:hypothetical protein